MKTFSQIALVALAVVLVPTLVNASIQVTGPDLISSRSTPLAGGLTGGGVWNNGGVTFGWNIHFNSTTDKWDYSYTITRVGQGDPSHWILELTHFDANGNDLTNYWKGLFSNVGGTEIGTFGTSMGNSNPGIPGDIFGIKVNGSAPLTFSTTHEPVWGDFYAKDGNAGGQGPNYAYNVGFTADVGSSQGGPDPQVTNFTNWVARPNGTPVVPEPGTIAVWGLLAVAGYFGMKKYQAKA